MGQIEMKEFFAEALKVLQSELPPFHEVSLCLVARQPLCSKFRGSHYELWLVSLTCGTTNAQTFV